MSAAPIRSSRASPLRARYFWFGLAGLVCAVPAALLTLTPPEQPLPVLADLPAFAFLDQDGRPFTLEGMKGRPVAANFVFTNCPTVCPRLTERMAELQRRTRALGNSVHLVSFSVDPERDTPEVLRRYGAGYGQDPARWSFVTGPYEQLRQTVVEGFRIGMDRRELPGVAPGTTEVEIVHGEHFVLVDRAGRIRSYYRAEDEPMQRLVRDLGRLAAESH